LIAGSVGNVQERGRPALKESIERPANEASSPALKQSNRRDREM
jgi:hypothetical protein